MWRECMSRVSCGGKECLVERPYHVERKCMLCGGLDSYLLPSSLLRAMHPSLDHLLPSRLLFLLVSCMGDRRSTPLSK